MNKGFAALLAIAIGVLIIAVAAGVVGYSLKSTPKPQPTATPSPTDETVYTEDARSANWKAYRNERLGFKFKYPPNWQTWLPSPTSDKLLLASYALLDKNRTKDPNDKLIIFEIEDNIAAEDLINSEERFPELFVTKESIIVDQVSAIKIIHDMNPKTPSLSEEQIIRVVIPLDKISLPIIEEYRKQYEVLKDRTFFLIISVSPNTRELQEIFAQILSTFQFSN